MQPLGLRIKYDVLASVAVSVAYSTLFVLLLHLSYSHFSRYFLVSRIIIFLNPTAYVAAYLTSFGSLLYRIGIIALGFAINFLMALIVALLVIRLARISMLLITVLLIAVVIWGFVIFR